MKFEITVEDFIPKYRNCYELGRFPSIIVTHYLGIPCSIEIGPTLCTMISDWDGLLLYITEAAKNKYAESLKEEPCHTSSFQPR